MRTRFLVLVVGAALAAAGCARAPEPLTPEAARAKGDALLKEMSKTLGGLQSFAYTAQEVREQVKAGQKVEKSVTRQVVIRRPNGVAFSPDERTLYVSNSDDAHRIWMRYDIAPSGNVSNGRVFFDTTTHEDSGLPDGMKIDVHGNVWATGPSAVFVFSPAGTHLGTIKPPEDPANCGWGDDGRTLYITAETGLYRIKTSVMGQAPVYAKF